MKKEGIDSTYVTLTDKALTGVGQLTILPCGQNRIVTVSGSNALLTSSDIEAAGPAISAAKVLLCENQIEHETALTALRLANKMGGKSTFHNFLTTCEANSKFGYLSTLLPVLTILNAAPACSNLDPEFFQLSDIFCVNETEVGVLMGKLNFAVSLSCS